MERFFPDGQRLAKKSLSLIIFVLDEPPPTLPRRMRGCASGRRKESNLLCARVFGRLSPWPVLTRMVFPPARCRSAAGEKKGSGWIDPDEAAVYSDEPRGGKVEEGATPMDPENSRRERLAQLLDLAEAYRGWTRKELARTLGRDPTKLIPGRGVPKLDLVVGLASALDWPVGDVVNFLWNHQPPPDVDGSGDFETLDAAARQAHGAGQYRLMVDLAQRAYGAADTPQERARACNREAGGWDGLARHTEVLRVVTRALQEKGVCAELRRVLESNLANAYYSLWSLVEARSIAQGLIDGYERQPPRTPRDRKTQAFARYVCGHTLRRLISLEPQRADAFATAARRHLDIARALYEQLAVELGDERLEGIANTCRGGIIEVDVELGRREVADALAELRDGLDEVWDTSDGN